jgi:hypothetical protein
LPSVEQSLRYSQIVFYHEVLFKTFQGFWSRVQFPFHTFIHQTQSTISEVLIKVTAPNGQQKYTIPSRVEEITSKTILVQRAGFEPAKPYGKGYPVESSGQEIRELRSFVVLVGKFQASNGARYLSLFCSSQTRLDHKSRSSKRQSP